MTRLRKLSIVLLLATFCMMGAALAGAQPAECSGAVCHRQIGQECWYDISCTNIGRCDSYCKKANRYARKGVCAPR